MECNGVNHEILVDSKSLNDNTLYKPIGSSSGTFVRCQQCGTGPVVALEDIVLACSSSVDGVTYSWHRVNGSIPYKSRGWNSNKLTIPRANPCDEGIYYCRASKNGISVKSNEAIVRVDGEEILCLFG